MHSSEQVDEPIPYTPATDVVGVYWRLRDPEGGYWNGMGGWGDVAKAVTFARRPVGEPWAVRVTVKRKTSMKQPDVYRTQSNDMRALLVKLDSVGTENVALRKVLSEALWHFEKLEGVLGVSLPIVPEIYSALGPATR